MSIESPETFAFAAPPHLNAILVSPPVVEHPLFRPNERLHHLFEAYCDGLGMLESRRRIAVEYPESRVSFKALDQRANRMARFLLNHGVRAGARVALLFDRSIDSHAAVLAVGKVGAIWVPLDSSYPPDRIAYILTDSDISIVLTLTQFVDMIPESPAGVLALDANADEIEKLSSRRVHNLVTTDPSDRTCYIIYTSGSTGRPKGVPIRHSSICAFLRAACERYGYKHTDRVYQGMTIAFDYSFEELWAPLLCGATLVPAPSGVNLVGRDLAEFLIDRKISALVCVPTVLASLDRPVPGLRFLMVSGEACPQDLADAWSAPARRFINSYGPTEITVSATWSVIEPGRPVSIGGPLPGYSIVILAPDASTVLPRGKAGEICIAGLGLSDGYLNLPEQTRRVFIDDFIGTPNNPSGKLYRTGDLGRINSQDEIDFLGRIDSQIKIRGYRVELDEIAAVARTVAAVGQAVVSIWESAPGQTELVTYYTRAEPSTPVQPADIHAAMRENLPPYMVSAFFEEMKALPLLPSTKVDRKRLPAPSGGRITSAGTNYQAPQSDIEQVLATELQSLLKIERISTDAHFFNELGASSLVMARFLAALAGQSAVRGLSMKAVYQNPTIAALSQVLEPTQEAPDGAQSAFVPPGLDLDALQTVTTGPGLADQAFPNGDPATSREPAHFASRFDYFLCGTLQLLYFVVIGAAASTATVISFTWVGGAETLAQLYLRAVASGALMFFGLSAFLIAVKWLMVGRFTAQKVPIWSLRYVRFWIARSAIQSNPLNLFLGTPLYNLYLRSLGARIGAGTVLFSRSAVCTDLLIIGEDTLIRPDCFYTGYVACDGWLQPGWITIGDRGYVGEASVLEINSSIGNDAQLGNSSALLAGKQIPDGTIWQGSPAEPSDTNFDRVPPKDLNRRRGVVYVTVQILVLVLCVLPIPFMLEPAIMSIEINSLRQLADEGLFTRLLPTVLTWSALVYAGTLGLALAVVLFVPRLLRLTMRVGEVHRLFGIQYYLAQMMSRMSNSRALNTIFGDSSMIVYYLSAIGYDLSQSTQTGSNFGVNQRHHSPFLCKFNRDTLVSDGLALMNLETSSTSFRLSQVTVAADNYLGNLIHYPANSRIGENCLIGTKAMVPIDGDLRVGVGILGSPPFEIPRSVVRDQRFDHYKKPGVLKERLRMKLRSNLVTLALYLFRNWTEVALVMGLGFAGVGLYDVLPGPPMIRAAASLALVSIVSLFVAPLYSIAFERIVLALYPLKPLYCSLYDRDFWQHERFWKLNYNALLVLFNGTPIKTWLLRCQGVKVGSMVFDDGVAITEPTLVQIGDQCCLNNYSSIQCHSLEDGTFKSDRIRIGSRCNLGVRGFIHYGTAIGDGASLQADSFLMKGSEIGAGESWLGNPARDSTAEQKQPIALKLPSGSSDINAGRVPAAPVEPSTLAQELARS